jgi:hypothetical protein
MEGISWNFQAMLRIVAMDFTELFLLVPITSRVGAKKIILISQHQILDTNIIKKFWN